MINLRKMAEDGVVFRFESKNDKMEFLDLYLKNRKSPRAFTNPKLLNYTWLFINEYGDLDIETYAGMTWCPRSWTEIKEKYRMEDKLKVTIGIDMSKIAKDMVNAIESSVRIMKENEIERSKKLLQSQGYKVEAPYVEPMDEEIIERLRFENEKVDQELNCYIYKQREDYKVWNSGECKIVGAIYTTNSIADRIVTELNEKRFER